MSISSRLLRSGALLLLAAALLAPGAAAQDRIDGGTALEYVKALAGEEMAGRMAGSRGGRMAGEYIASRFKAWGLEPAGANGYFQEFTSPTFEIEAAELTLRGEKWSRTLEHGEEWRVAENSGSAESCGEIVFAGYGIVSEKDGWDEFAGLDLRGKTVMFIAYGAPSFMAGRFGPHMMPEAKVARAYELGARAVLLLGEPADTATVHSSYPFPAGAMLDASAVKADMAVAGLNADAVRTIFRDSGIDLNARIRKLENDRKPVSCRLGIKADLKIRTDRKAAASLRNVLALIGGSDPVLKNEYIVIGGHYDHLGLTPDGRVRPGADDNASGTAVIMELARVMKAGKARPKRTVIFALWDGEEQGLLGSLYYCSHPVRPLDRTLLNINLDMVGHGDGGLQFRGAYYGPDVWSLLKKELPAEALDGVVPTRGGPGGSDHTPFLAGGVPAFFIQTTGPHYGRHDVGDGSGLIDPALLRKSAAFVRAVVDVLADARSLKPDPAGREMNVLRSSTLVDLTPRRAADLLKEAAALEYPDLDFALTGLEGGTPIGLIESLIDTTAAVQASDKALLYEPPDRFNRPAYGPKIGVLPGIPELIALSGHDELLALMKRSGLGFITVKDGDLARNEEETRRMVAAADAAGVLVIARVQPDNAVKVLGWSSRPGLLVGDVPEECLMKMLREHGWQLALDWKSGLTPEAYAGMYKQAVKTMGPRSVLIQADGYGLKGFSAPLVKLTSLLVPDELNERQIMTGGLDEFGQNFIQMLWNLTPRTK